MGTCVLISGSRYYCACHVVDAAAAGAGNSDMNGCRDVNFPVGRRIASRACCSIETRFRLQRLCAILRELKRRWNSYAVVA
jgi:hypothetical protein